MKYLSTYQIFESKVDDKIQLLKDLAIELQDAGLEVQVINGSHSYLLRDPRVSIHTGSRYTNDYKNFIIMTVMDINNRFNTDLFNTDIIDEFKETLKSYGMNPRGMSGGRNFCVFKFDKWSKMTDSPILRESIHDTKEEIEEIVSTCKDILLEANDTFSGNSSVEKSYKDDKLTITCAYTVPFNTKAKIEEYKSAMNDIHSRLIEYMTSHGFTYINRGDKSTAYFDIMVGNITYNISFSKDLDREFIGHLRYLKKYNIKESNSNWIEVNGKLQCKFEFNDFLESLNFINKIAQICELENHHPEINWTYNKITLKLSTHDAGDIITEKDIKLSKLIDEVLKTL